MDSAMGAWAKKPQFRRPQFREGQLLTAQALNAQQTDGIERLRLLVRAMFGRGVVFGYKLGGVAKGCLAVSTGLALDDHGRELFWPGGSVCLSELVGQPPSQPGKYTLVAHYAEHHTGRELPGHCEGDDTDWIEQAVVFSLVGDCKTYDCCKCPEPECGDCFDTCDYVCARTGSVDGPVPHASDLDLDCRKPPALCPTGKPGWYYDPKAGIPLACVEICHGSPTQSGCEPPLTFNEAPGDVCHTRPFAYRNPLLFELINGCHLDLARVKSLGSWQDWFVAGSCTEVSLSKFKERLGCSNSFEIEFSRPVRINTLHPASIRLTATFRVNHCEVTHGIPLEDIKAWDTDGQGKCARRAIVVIDKDWIKAHVTCENSPLFGGTLIELTIRGALIRDCCDKVLDARPLDIAEDLCAPAMPGDDFVAVFRVARKPQESGGWGKPEPSPATAATPKNTSD